MWPGGSSASRERERAVNGGRDARPTRHDAPAPVIDETLLAGARGVDTDLIEGTCSRLADKGGIASATQLSHSRKIRLSGQRAGDTASDRGSMRNITIELPYFFPADPGWWYTIIPGTAGWRLRRAWRRDPNCEYAIMLRIGNRSDFYECAAYGYDRQLIVQHRLRGSCGLVTWNTEHPNKGIPEQLTTPVFSSLHRFCTGGTRPPGRDIVRLTVVSRPMARSLYRESWSIHVMIDDEDRPLVFFPDESLDDFSKAVLSVLERILPESSLRLGRRSRHDPMPAGDCWNCGYSLRGLESNRCPECGLTLEEYLRQRYPSPPRKPRKR